MLGQFAAVSSRRDQQQAASPALERVLLAGRAGRETESQPVYRVHEAPGDESLAHLERTIARMVEVHGLHAQVFRWRRGEESLADFLERLPEDPARVRDAIERQVLLSNQRSVYSAEPGPHYALGVTCYSRFSSPMREVVGVFTHKEAMEQLGMMEPASSPEQDEQLREQIIQAANRAKQLQSRITKDVTRLAVDQLLGEDLKMPEPERPTYTGTLTGLTATRLYVRLDAPPVDIKVYLQDLQSRLGLEFQLQRDGVELASPDRPDVRFRAGDRIELRTAAYDPERGRWHMVPIATKASATSASA